jgi:hypothetical protein
MVRGHSCQFGFVHKFVYYKNIIRLFTLHVLHTFFKPRNEINSVILISMYPHEKRAK